MKTLLSVLYDNVLAGASQDTVIEIGQDEYVERTINKMSGFELAEALSHALEELEEERK